MARRKCTLQDQALPLRGPLPLEPRAASPSERNFLSRKTDIMLEMTISSEVTNFPRMN